MIGEHRKDLFAVNEDKQLGLLWLANGGVKYYPDVNLVW